MIESKAWPQWLDDAYHQAQHWQRSKKFHHALLVSGVNGVGQSVYAEAVARLLLCEQQQNSPCGQCHSCQVAMAGSHPDRLTLDGRVGSIKVDDVRQVVAKVANRPQLGFSKVVVIHDAHQMNMNASNAILKALEEPPDATFFILTTNTSKTLMPTILSRCQRLVLPQPTPQQVRDWLYHEANVDVSAIMWFTTTPFHLLAVAESPSFTMLRDLPSAMVAWLQGQKRVDELVALMPKDHVYDFVDALSALIAYAVSFSATGRCDPEIEAAVKALLVRYDLYRLMTFAQRLVTLRTQLDKTHLNPTIQLIGELNSW